MPSKKTVSKKSSVVTIPVSWLIAGVLFFGTVMAVQAVNSNKKIAGINEVKTSNQGAVEGAYTGIVSREAAAQGEKEKYFLTTDSGAKFILVGLKKSYEDKDAKDKIAKVREENAKSAKIAGKPAPKQKMPPMPDTEDANSFEQYEGLKVTIIGLAIPVLVENNKKELKPAGTPSVKKDGTPVSDKGQYGKAQIDKVQTENTGRIIKTEVMPSTKKIQTPPSGWDYERLVVKAIAIAQ